MHLVNPYRFSSIEPSLDPFVYFNFDTLNDDFPHLVQAIDVMGNLTNYHTENLFADDVTKIGNYSVTYDYNMGWPINIYYNSRISNINTVFNNPFTFSIWINHRDFDETPLNITYNLITSNQLQYKYNKINDEHTIGNSGGFFIIDVQENTWHNIIAVYDGTILKIYFDKEYINGVSFSFSSGKTNDILIGNSTMIGFNIDELKIFSYAMNQTQIDEIYDTTITMASPPN